MLKDILDHLNLHFPERRVEIDALVMSLLTKQHGFLLGKPGTGKSLLISTLASCLGIEYFGILATGETRLDEIIGPVDIKSFRDEGEYKRRLAGLATCHVGFIDEIFKTSSIVRNGLLRIMQERAIRNADETVRVPLISAFTASNELPTEELDGPFFDRLLFSVEVHPIKSEADLATMILRENTNGEIVPNPLMTLEQLQQAQYDVQHIDVDYTSTTLFVKLCRRLEKELSYISDRRKSAALGVAKVGAYLGNRKAIRNDDLYLTKYALIMMGTEKEKIFDRIAEDLIGKADLFRKIEEDCHKLSAELKKFKKKVDTALQKEDKVTMVDSLRESKVFISKAKEVNIKANDINSNTLATLTKRMVDEGEKIRTRLLTVVT